MEKSITQFGTLTYTVIGTGKQTLVLIPPGPGNSNEFDTLVSQLQRNYRLVLVNLPGMNGSHFIHSNIQYIAKGIIKICTDLDIQHPLLVGVSYGGNVALSISELVPVQGLILIVSGEYFSMIEKYVLKLTFLLPKKVTYIRVPLGKILTMLGLYKFSQCTKEDYDNLLNRWLEILSYTLPDVKIQQPALLFFATKDKIINKKSIVKIHNIFQKKTISYISSGHLNVLTKFSDKEYKLINDYLSTVS